MPKQRYIQFGFFLACIALVASFGLEYLGSFHPCPLCQLQRIALGCTLLFLLLTLWFRIGFLKRLTLLTSCLLNIAGFLLAGRQIWLQHASVSNNMECGVGMTRLFDLLPWNEALLHILKGTGDCAERSDTLLSVDLSIWSAALFFVLIVLSIRGWSELNFNKRNVR